jgi:undecaprenyl diphosphate synthase
MHVAIIMDGNGRWATRRGLPRAAGHRAGAKTLARVVDAAAPLGVETLTVFAFSSDNWRRPAAEVYALMGLLGAYLHDESERHARKGTRLSFIGRRDRLPPRLADAMARAEAQTQAGARLHLRVALDYSARESISRVLGAAPGGLERDALGRLIAQWPNDGSPDVDLMIRTGGEKRLSDFLLWECAYAELAFLEMMWPEFTPATLAAAVADFRRRERRFGGLGASRAAAIA